MFFCVVVFDDALFCGGGVVFKCMWCMVHYVLCLKKGEIILWNSLNARAKKDLIKN